MRVDADSDETSGRVGVSIGPGTREGPDRSETSVLTAEGQGGVWHPEGGGWRAGAQGHGELISGHTGQLSEHAQLEGGIGANLDAWVGSDGFALGATAGPGFATTLGDADPSSDRDERLRLGIGAGPGAAIRGHLRDEDQDGHIEMGVGLDLGWFTGDYTVEAPEGSLVEDAARWWRDLM